MRTGQAVARALQAQGLISELETAAVEDTVERMTRPDYIPGGKSVSKVKDLRPSDPGARCCCQTSYDIQSGPIFCGEPADWMADAADGQQGTAAVCNGHKGVLTRILK